MKQTIIRTNGEENALIPDKWVVGRGLSTDSLYIVHTAGPLMIFQYPPAIEENKTANAPCTVYLSGEINPERLSRLFAEACELLEIYKSRNTPHAGTK